MKYKKEIKTGADFENDPEGALDALSKTGFAIFVISKEWYTDKRAQQEWRFAKDMKKPILDIIRESGRADFHYDMFTENLIGTVNDYGNTKETANFVDAIIQAYIHN